jgi:hypothetical protein
MTMHKETSPITAVAMLRVIGVLEAKIEIAVLVALAAPREVAHDFLLLAEADRSRRGMLAWALCLTLSKS